VVHETLTLLTDGDTLHAIDDDVFDWEFTRLQFEAELLLKRVEQGRTGWALGPGQVDFVLAGASGAIPNWQPIADE
jgi:hypothetical protein